MQFPPFCTPPGFNFTEPDIWDLHRHAVVPERRDPSRRPRNYSWAQLMKCVQRRCFRLQMLRLQAEDARNDPIAGTHGQNSGVHRPSVACSSSPPQSGGFVVRFRSRLTAQRAAWAVVYQDRLVFYEQPLGAYNDAR